MINLLPSEIKQHYSYARRNTTLLRWSVALLITIVGAGIVIAGGAFYTESSIKSLSKQNEEAQQTLKDQKLEETEAKVQEVSGSIKLSVQVLSRQILFSRLINQIGAVMPPNTSLTDLQIATDTPGINLSAVARDYRSATQVQVNLQDPANQVFDKADILNISCPVQVQDDSGYPCKVSIRAQFGSSNPFLFIESRAGATP